MPRACHRQSCGWLQLPEFRPRLRPPVALPCLLFAVNGQKGTELRSGGDTREGDGLAGGTLLTLKGGTDADMAPPIDYLAQVFAPTMQRLFGLDSLEVSRGYKGVTRG